MQQFMLVGRVGNNVSYFDSGKTPVARVSIADNITYRDSETGEKKQYTTWIPIVGFGQRAEFMKNHLQKGSMVAITANWRNNVYEKEGETHYDMICVLRDVQFCESKGKRIENPEFSDEPETEAGFQSANATPFDPEK